MSEYPEHDKMHAIQDDAQIVGEFIEWLEAEGYHIARYEEVQGYSNPQLIVTSKSTLDILYQYTGIDPQKIETEKRDMLAKMRDL